MKDYQSLSHTKWECKYHVVFIPKGRRTALSGQLRAALGEGCRELARQKGSKVEEGPLRADRVHLLLSIPPQYAVSQVGGSLTGKSAIYSARTFGGEQGWARGYFGSPVGRDETVIRQDLEHQETEDKRAEQLAIFQKP